MRRISLKGKRRVSLSSAERCSLVTIVTCMNATVTYVPPLLVFPRSNMKAELRVALHQVQRRLVTRLDGGRKTALRNGSKNVVRFVKLCYKRYRYPDTG